MGRFTVVVTLLGLFISFQNFTNVPLDVLRPQLSTAQARAVSPTDGRADMRELAPSKPRDEDESVIAVPQSGHDLESIGQDWAARQTNAITGGAEQKILQKMNKKMSSWIGDDDTQETEANNSARKPASAKADGTNRTDARQRTFYFSRVNKMDMDLALDTHLSCQYLGSSVQWDLSRNVVGDVDLNLRHDSKDATNSIHLKYNW